MAVSGKYGNINIPGIGEDEPVFVLRAQDKLAVPAIQMYRSLSESHGSSVVSALGKEIDRFQQWKGNRKLPD